MLSIRAVTVCPRTCRVAQTPAAVSTSFMMTPPWTFPNGFASPGSITWLITIRDSRTVRASTIFCLPLGRCRQPLTFLDEGDAVVGQSDVAIFLGHRAQFDHSAGL